MRSRFVPLEEYRELPVEEMKRRAAAFYADVRRRRSVREFSPRPVPREVIDECLRVAGAAPSGANMQPWHFVVVTDRGVKSRIRQEAERVEAEFYGGKAPKEWLDALAPLGTDEVKPYLETAPYLIVVFSRLYGVDGGGRKVKQYYALESVGIATGFLILAVHNAGLVSLTHTPSPMAFLNKVLGRPSHERPFLLLAVGYPADDARVPSISRKPLEEIRTFV
jgi:iodotyrosine deiodinase